MNREPTNDIPHGIPSGWHKGKVNMRKLSYPICAWLLAAGTLQAQEISFSVRHDHTLDGCRGELIFSPGGVEYRTAHKEDARFWKYEDIQQLGLLGPRDISILTFEDAKWRMGKDRAFRFEITSGVVTPALAALLREKLARPLVSALPPEGAAPKYAIPARHRRGFGGTSGTLEISDEYIVYRTASPRDSRVWRYRDISSLGTTGPYQLRLTTVERVQGEFGEERNFVFDLKKRLEDEVYDFIWWKINGAAVSPAAARRPAGPS